MRRVGRKGGSFFFPTRVVLVARVTYCSAPRRLIVLLLLSLLLPFVVCYGKSACDSLARK